MLQRKKLPVGIQTFREIRQDNYYYIDKTGLAKSLVNSGEHYLLFQTGYLTIKQEENLGGQIFYTLGYPNREVFSLQ